MLVLTTLTAVGRFVKVWRAATAVSPEAVSARRSADRDSRWREWRERQARLERARRGRALAMLAAPSTSRRGPEGRRSRRARALGRLTQPRALRPAPGEPSADRRRYLLWRTLGTAPRAAPRRRRRGGGRAHAAGLPASLATRTHERGRDRTSRRITEHGSTTPIDERVLERWVRRSFASYGRYWAEGATLPAQSGGRVLERFEIVEGRSTSTRRWRAGRGCIIALPHVGSWEWGGALLAQIGYPMTAVAEDLEPPELFEWFVAKREAMGLHIEPLGPERRAQAALGVLGDGGLVGLLCDRDIEGNGIEVELLGARTTMPAGPATLALRTGATLLVGGDLLGSRSTSTAALISPPVSTERRRPAP